MSSMYPSFGGAPSRPCTRCGIPLAINETQCSRCGTYNPLPQGQQFGMFQQGAQGGGPNMSGPSWGGQGQGPTQPPGNGAWPGSQGASAPAWGAGMQAGNGWQQNNNTLFGGQGQTAQPSQPLQQNLFGSGFVGQNASSFSNFPQSPNQSAINGSFPGTSFQQNTARPSLNTFFQATQQNNGFGGGAASPMMPNANRPAWMKKPGDDDDDDDNGKSRPSKGVVAVIIILVVVLLGGGGFGGYYLLRHRSGNANNTVTAQAIVTPSTTPLFSDTFQNNSKGWSTTTPTGAKVTLSGNGKLVLESDNNTLFPEFLPGGQVFGDFRIDVDAGLTSGDIGNGYGIYIRAASTQNSTLGLYYRFEVYGDGNYVVYKGSQTANGNLQVGNLVTSSAPSPAIGHVGTMNHLTIIAKGQQMTLIVNNTTVANFTDAAYKSGTIALFVSNLPKIAPGAQATFERLAIFPEQ